jgi:membrane AbrB-like protein
MAMDPRKGRLGGHSPVAQWIVLIGLSAVLGGLLSWLHAPAALLLGPLIAGVIVATGSGTIAPPVRPVVVAQGLVGCMIANMVPLSIVSDILRHWPLFAFGVVAVIAASTALGWLMTRLQVLPGTTALWGLSPGAASVMTLMAESYGADIRLVAFMQYLRVVMVAGIAALVARLWGIDTPHMTGPIVWFPPLDALGLVETLALAISGPLIARALRIPAGAFLLPLVAGVVLKHHGWMAIELPPWLLAACYALVGWTVGLRFTRPLLIHAARALLPIVGCALILIALCGAIAALLVALAGVDPLTAYLATSPGGADSIAIIAASSNVDVSFVMAMQTVRLIAVLFLAPLLTRFIAVRVGR